MIEQQDWFGVAVENHIDAEDGIGELGFPLFCPRERVFKVRRGRKVKEDRPLFLGYVFTSFDREAKTWGAIEHVDGVLGILKNCGVPVAAKNEQIAELRLAETMGMFDRTKPPSVGINVETAEGPLSGLIGKIARARTAERVEVALKGLFGRVVKANVPLAMLREV